MTRKYECPFDASEGTVRKGRGKSYILVRTDLRVSEIRRRQRSWRQASENLKIHTDHELLLKSIIRDYCKNIVAGEVALTENQ